MESWRQQEDSDRWRRNVGVSSDAGQVTKLKGGHTPNEKRSAASRTTRGITHQTRTFYTNKLPEMGCNGCVLVYPVVETDDSECNHDRQLLHRPIL